MDVSRGRGEEEELARSFGSYEFLRQDAQKIRCGRLGSGVDCAHGSFYQVLESLFGREDISTGDREHAQTSELD
jgi:hypothetical protein